MTPDEWRRYYAAQAQMIRPHTIAKVVPAGVLGPHQAVVYQQRSGERHYMLFARNAGKREYMKQLRRSAQQGLCPGLKIVDGKLPVLKRGKLRTLALREAQTVNWVDPRANLYGVYPCPRCGEPDVRASYQRPHGHMIECDSCGDKRPVRRVVER